MSADVRKAAGKLINKPNAVMHSNVHVCWKKAAPYLEVENRYCFCTADRYTLDPQEAVSLVDENTILVCAILGSTYTGEYEDVQALNDRLQEKNDEDNLDVHIHVDAVRGALSHLLYNHIWSGTFSYP